MYQNLQNYDISITFLNSLYMDPVRNPCAPGAGSPPPELASRGALRADIAIRLKRLRLGRPAKSFMMVGRRGVGKTVLLDRIRRDAEADGIQTVRIEAPALRLALLHLSNTEAAKKYAVRGLRALAGFTSPSSLPVGFHPAGCERLLTGCTGDRRRDRQNHLRH
jgi:hypothetical protein